MHLLLISNSTTSLVPSRSEVQRQLLLLPDAELLDVHALWPSLELAVARCDVGVTSVLSDLLEPHGDFLLLLNTAGLAEKALQQHEPVAGTASQAHTTAGPAPSLTLLASTRVLPSAREILSLQLCIRISGDVMHVNLGLATQ